MFSQVYAYVCLHVTAFMQIVSYVDMFSLMDMHMSTSKMHSGTLPSLPALCSISPTTHLSHFLQIHLICKFVTLRLLLLWLWLFYVSHAFRICRCRYVSLTYLHISICRRSDCSYSEALPAQGYCDCLQCWPSHGQGVVGDRNGHQEDEVKIWLPMFRIGLQSQ